MQLKETLRVLRASMLADMTGRKRRFVSGGQFRGASLPGVGGAALFGSGSSSSSGSTYPPLAACQLDLGAGGSSKDLGQLVGNLEEMRGALAQKRAQLREALADCDNAKGEREALRGEL